MDELLFSQATAEASIGQLREQHESMSVIGVYHVKCYDADGNLKWEDTAPNLVTTAGKNFALDTYLSGSAYTVVGPYMGLVSGASAPTYDVTNIMTSHAGWIESGNANPPTYTAPRKTVVWNGGASGGSKSNSSAPASFGITGTGTVAGCFIVTGSGAVTTIDNTAGTLYSCGSFTGGNRAVVNGDTLNVTYTATLT